MDYGQVTVEPCYVQSVKNVPVVSKCASSFILGLFEARRDIEPENFHVVGFSLGAQVAGKIGTILRESNFYLRRITGESSQRCQSKIREEISRNPVTVDRQRSDSPP